MQFSHLHVHTQFSLLDGASDIKKLYKKAITDEMPALAITDHGNMFGAFEFVAEAYKHKHADGRVKVKPIVGCEFYVVNTMHKKSFTKDDRDQRFHQLFLAKNPEGYSNLVKLCSLGYTEGMYSKYPRIDKELILKYHKGIIATTCCIGASVPKAILKKSEAEAEKEFKWWLDLFGEDYYVELQRHDMPEQKQVNEVLISFAIKHGVKIIASNDSHYIDQADSVAHDILLCINTGSTRDTPTNKDLADEDVLMKGRRFAFYNDQFYFKTTAEMTQLFADMPQAIDNTNEIVDKVDLLNLKKDILLPNYEIPTNFTSQDEYLTHLAFSGAKNRYGDILPDVEERLNFELHTIKTMGFAGYFLIVADFIRAGRELGVLVGPGRGSAAGSAVAYCIGITNIDPIKYNLLFERFLNPDRKSMPDIDTDFDDEGRQKVIDYVVNKYGRNQVAQIITYGTMAAKSSIKDVARVLDLKLNESNALTKLVPDKPGITLARIFHAALDGEGSIKEKEGLQPEDMDNVKKLRDIYAGKDLQAEVLHQAEKLEGSIRNTGVHAAGIIIAPMDLKELLPVAVAKDSELLVTQFEGSIIEDAGVIKMDFLGLRNLGILKEALRIIKEIHNVDIVLDEIPLDDKKTYQLYQKGETNGTFQFESPGMQKHLKALIPDKFEDLIAMNALYRPGPMQYIPKFIARKLGQEKISYDLPEMSEFLEETYGITVYQEQVMLLSQKLAGFSKGDADVLRKAMGKKDRQTLDKMQGRFMEGGLTRGFKEEILEKIWNDWVAFAQYAFNKSHSTCYAFVAFQTAYLKANYPAEYMSAVLVNCLGNIEKVSFMMEECKRMGIKVLGPDVNESSMNFSVNKKGEIRFGLGAIKGVGELAAESIINERNENGPYENIFDLTKRSNLRAVNKKALESLAISGGFDCFMGVHRAQYFAKISDDTTALERAVRYGANFQGDDASNQQSLFGGAQTVSLPEPVLPQTEPWTLIATLKAERDAIGMYLSAHPLDPFRFDVERLCTHQLTAFADLPRLINRDIKFVGIVTIVNHRISKQGKPFGSFTLEDYSGTHEIALFGDDYVNNRKFMELDYTLFCKARVQNRWGKDTEFELKISAIEMLADIRDKYFKLLFIDINMNSLNDELMTNLEHHFKLHKGNCNVHFRIVDKKTGNYVKLISTKIKVCPSNALIDALDKLDLHYKIV